MSPPIYTPDGSEVSEIVLPDGSTASEVIDPDGNVVFEAGPDIPDSGVARYEFEQDVTDSWGDFDATDNTGVGYTTDSAVGTYAKLFNESGDVDLPSLPITLGGGGDFSMSIWFYSTSNSDQVLFRLGDEETVLRTNNDGTGDYVLYVQTTGGVDIFEGTTDLTDGIWRMVTVTYDSSTDTFTGYINGSSEGTGTGASWTNDGNVLIGQRGDNVWELNGRADDARIYDKELTSTEVSNLFNTGSI